MSDTFDIPRGTLGNNYSLFPPPYLSLSLTHTVCLQRLSGTRSWQRYFQQRPFRSALARASDARSAAISIACPSRAISRGARVARHAIERNLDASAAKVIEEGRGGEWPVVATVSRRLQHFLRSNGRKVVSSRKIARYSSGRARRSFINVPVRRFPPGYQLFVGVK